MPRPAAVTVAEYSASRSAPSISAGSVTRSTHTRPSASAMRYVGWVMPPRSADAVSGARSAGTRSASCSSSDAVGGSEKLSRAMSRANLHQPAATGAWVAPVGFAAVEQRSLGASGPGISVVGYGSWEAGGDEWGPNSSDRRVVEAMQSGLDAGMTWIDTAEVYGQGVSEQLCGRALEGRRDGALVFTKVAPDDEGSGIRPEQIGRAI